MFKNLEELTVLRARLVEKLCEDTKKQATADLLMALEVSTYHALSKNMHDVNAAIAAIGFNHESV